MTTIPISKQSVIQQFSNLTKKQQVEVLTKQLKMMRLKSIGTKENLIIKAMGYERNRDGMYILKTK
jgi:hypothetical protein